MSLICINLNVLRRNIVDIVSVVDFGSAARRLLPAWYLGHETNLNVLLFLCFHGTPVKDHFSAPGLVVVNFCGFFHVGQVLEVRFGSTGETHDSEHHADGHFLQVGDFGKHAVGLFLSDRNAAGCETHEDARKRVVVRVLVALAYFE